MASIDITRVIDEQKLGWFNVRLIIVSFFLCLIDGYDFAAINFAAPGIVKAWAITHRAALGPVFSASLIGILIGSPLFGYIGDRFGRKRITVISCFICSIFVWASVYANSLDQLLVLRFLSGLGMGGLLPNTIALNAEYAPRRMRFLLVVAMFTGTPLGAAIPGVISAWFMATYGWTILFAVGGAISIFVAIASAIWLPESIKYLALREERRADTAKLVRTLRPDLNVGADDRFIISDEKQYSGISPKYLFSGNMALGTPLLWLLFIVNVPYKGSSEVLTDLLGGRIDVMFDATPIEIPQVKQGVVSGVAVTGRERLAALPEVGTFTEGGFPVFSDVSNYYVLLATPGTPPAVVQKLRDEVAKAVKSPDVIELFDKQGMKPAGSQPGEVTAMLAGDLARWTDVMVKAGIEPK